MLCSILSKAYANVSTYRVRVQDKFTLQDGASASSPIVASLFNRIIEERIRVGKGPLGFLNPSMYQNPHLFNDIVRGDNWGCPGSGFQAVSHEWANPFHMFLDIC